MKVAGLVDVDICVQEVYLAFRVLALKFYRGDPVYFLEEFEQSCFSARPYQKDIIFKSSIHVVSVIDPWKNMLSFEAAHKQVGIRAGAFCPHGTSFNLEIVLVIKAKVIEMEY